MLANRNALYVYLHFSTFVIAFVFRFFDVFANIDRLNGRNVHVLWFHLFRQWIEIGSNVVTLTATIIKCQKLFDTISGYEWRSYEISILLHMTKGWFRLIQGVLQKNKIGRNWKLTSCWRRSKKNWKTKNENYSRLITYCKLVSFIYWCIQGIENHFEKTRIRYF